MSPEKLEETLNHLLPLAVLSALSVIGFLSVHLDRLPVLRFRRAARAIEPPLWSPLEIVFVLLSWFVAQIVVVPFLSPLDPDGTFFILVATLASQTLFVAFLFWLVPHPLGQPLTVLGLRWVSLRNLLPVTALYVFLLCPLSVISLAWAFLLQSVGVEAEIQEPAQHFSEVVRQRDFVTAGALALLGTVAAPLSEELLFRGVVFGGLAQRWGVRASAVASSLLFAAVHFSMTAFCPLFCMALVLCYVYVRTGSLYMAIAFHSLFNAVSFALLYVEAMS